MFRTLIFLFFLPFICFGQIPEPKPDTYVNDYTGKLSEGEIAVINSQLFKLEKQTSVQMAVLLIDSLPNDMPIEDYAREVGNKWKVGNNYNGIVYVAVLKERKHRLEIAKNLEGDIPDMIAARIIDALVPYLREEDYYHAILLLVDQVSKRLGMEPEAKQDSSFNQSFIPPPEDNSVAQQRAEYDREKAKYDHYGNIAMIGLVIAAILFCFWAWMYKRIYVRRNTVNGVYMGIGSSYFNSVYGDSYNTGSGGSGGSSGFGGWGGGGGGGGFSGGGASGSW